LLSSNYWGVSGCGTWEFSASEVVFTARSPFAQ
jgi:hypothetical protein